MVSTTMGAVISTAEKEGHCVKRPTNKRAAPSLQTRQVVRASERLRKTNISQVATWQPTR